MNKLPILVLCLIATRAFAQSGPEAISVLGEARFAAAVSGFTHGQFRPVGCAVAPADSGEFSAAVLSPIQFQTRRAAPSIEMDLTLMLNRHAKTSLRYQLSGRTVWFSGTFNHEKTAYGSILVEGQAPMYFDVKALLNRDETVTIGGTNFTISLSPDIFNKLNSKIVVKNDSTGNEDARFSVKNMLDAVSAVGQAVVLSDRAYKVYYGYDLKNGRVDKDARLIMFIYGSGQDAQLYLIPEEQVPADRVGVFKMFKDQRVGLSRKDGRLQVYSNP